MACTLNTILAGEQAACEESFSGTGSRIYIGLVSQLAKKPTKADVDPDTAEFFKDAFGDLQGRLVAWDIEEETGEVTYETNPGGGGFNNKIEVTIRKRMHKVAHDLRILNNVKFFVFVPASEGYYVFYSVMGSAKLESATGTTGKTASDEHGHTITVSASPMYYPMMTWNPGVDLDNWIIAETDSGEIPVTFPSTVKVMSGNTPVVTGQYMNNGTLLTITPTDSSKSFSSVKIGNKDAALSEDGKSATLFVTGNGQITVTFA